MSQFEDTIGRINAETNVKIIGIMNQTARIKNGIGKDASDILGFDYIMKESNGSCVSYYAAEPPRIGMSTPVPVTCPLGVIAFDGYKVTYKDAIAIFQKANCGDFFVAVSLAWPLTFPETKEPFWHIRSNLGFDLVIGANSGQPSGEPLPKYMGPTVVKYMGPTVVKYMGPQE